MTKPKIPRVPLRAHFRRPVAFRGPHRRFVAPHCQMAQMAPRAFSTLPGSSKASTVHVLGIGNIGLLFAHSIAQSHGARSVTLLFHRETLTKQWDAVGRETELVWDGVADRQKGYNFEILQTPPQQHAGDTVAPPQDAIHNLIIATKATKTLAAFSAIRHRLTPQSTILFCQNGMGIMDELEEKFPDAVSNSHPHYMAGIVTHGVYSTGPFHIVHAGRGKVTMGSLRVPGNAESQPQYLSELLTRTPALAAVQVPALALVRAQLEKLVVNAIINPLTVLFNCRNGQLFRESDTSNSGPGSMDMIHDPATKLMHLLLSEICQVIQSLPEVQMMPGKEEIFSTTCMRNVVIDVATKTGANTSSMLQDFRANRRTEIEYINGYIVRKGAQLGIACGINDRVFKIVEGGRKVSIEEIMQIFPELCS